MGTLLLTSESPRCTQPSEITLALKPHQLAALYVMCNIDTECKYTTPQETVHTNVCVYSDHPGYGKTIVLLSLISILAGSERLEHMRNINVLNTTAEYGCTVSTHTTHECIRTTLVVVPDILVDSPWVKHIDAYTSLNYEIVTKESLHTLLIGDHDLLLVPASLYNALLAINRVRWARIIFDEADSINIPNTRTPRARFIWLVSGTSKALTRRRNRGFIKALFSTSGCEQFININSEHDFTRMSFTLADPILHAVECKMYRSAQIVHAHVKSHVLAMINGGDISGAVTALGGNVESGDTLVELVTRGFRNDLIALEHKRSALDAQDLHPAERDSRIAVLNERTATLRERLEAITHAINTTAAHDCPICLERLSSPVHVSCCSNIFCGACLLRWHVTSESCPMCKCTSPVITAIGVSSDEKPFKHEALLRIVSNSAGRYIIASTFPDTFAFLGKILKNAGVQYGTLSTAKIAESTLTHFNAGDIRVILLDAKHNGAGIDISTATDVILMHTMTPETETQVIARAQRPGRTETLHVWRLQYPSETAPI